MESCSKKYAFRAGKFLVRFASNVAELVVLAFLLSLLILGVYSLLEDQSIFQQASAAQFEIYKPSAEDTLSFEQLCEKNGEVIGWLTIYGTEVDYPLTQSTDNEKYLRTSAIGQPTSSGALYLDYRNAPDFSDFNSVIYGHHMEKSMMFGDLEKFSDRTFFEEHAYGNLFFEGKNHGLEFFAFLEIDGYDYEYYTPAIAAEEDRMDNIELLKQNAFYTRALSLGTEDHIVILYTCSSNRTNGRYLLVGKLTDTTFSDPYWSPKDDRAKQQQFFRADGSFWKSPKDWPQVVWLGILLWLLLIALASADAIHRRRQRKNRNKGDTHDGTNL